jgi:hypothetical protein
MDIAQNCGRASSLCGWQGVYGAAMGDFLSTTIPSGCILRACF